jgi:hypothetical protein
MRQQRRGLTPGRSRTTRRLRPRLRGRTLGCRRLPTGGSLPARLRFRRRPLGGGLRSPGGFSGARTRRGDLHPGPCRRLPGDRLGSPGGPLRNGRGNGPGPLRRGPAGGGRPPGRGRRSSPDPAGYSLAAIGRGVERGAGSLRSCGRRLGQLLGTHLQRFGGRLCGSQRGERRFLHRVFHGCLPFVHEGLTETSRRQTSHEDEQPLAYSSRSASWRALFTA